MPEPGLWTRPRHDFITIPVICQSYIALITRRIRCTGFGHAIAVTVARFAADILVRNAGMIHAIGQAFMRRATAEAEIRRTRITDRPTAMAISGFGDSDPSTRLIGSSERNVVSRLGSPLTAWKVGAPTATGAA